MVVARYCRDVNNSGVGSFRCLALALALALAGCGDGASRSARKGQGGRTDVDACVDRGVAYFKEIGSYPTLRSKPDTGRQAEDVARERCTRTTTAF